MYRDAKYLVKEAPKEPPAEVVKNPYYSKVLYAQDQALNLQKMALTDADATAIAEALKRNGNISVVDLRIPRGITLIDGNHIGAKGVAAMAEALVYNCAITTLDFCIRRALTLRNSLGELRRK